MENLLFLGVPILKHIRVFFYQLEDLLHITVVPKLLITVQKH